MTNNFSNGWWCPQIRFVVPRTGGVEVEAAEPTLIQQERDNRRDVRALGMMTRIDQHIRLIAKLERTWRRLCPVR